jgi:hypothetical protein
MERQKWDALFLDAPPFKFLNLHEAGPRPGDTVRPGAEAPGGEPHAHGKDRS